MDYVHGTLIGACSTARTPYVVIATDAGHRVCWYRQSRENPNPRKACEFWERQVGKRVVASVEPTSGTVIGYGMDFE